MIEELKVLVGLSWLDRIRFIKKRFYKTQSVEVMGYQSRTLNPWGDETSNSTDKATNEMINKANNEIKKKKYTIDPDVWDKIEDFAKDAKAAGSKVVLAYQNIYTPYLDID